MSQQSTHKCCHIFPGIFDVVYSSTRGYNFFIDIDITHNRCALTFRKFVTTRVNNVSGFFLN